MSIEIHFLRYDPAQYCSRAETETDAALLLENITEIRSAMFVGGYEMVRLTSDWDSEHCSFRFIGDFRKCQTNVVRLCKLDRTDNRGRGYSDSMIHAIMEDYIFKNLRPPINTELAGITQ